MQQIIDSYQRYLETTTPSAHTLQGYTADLAFFARWFEQGRGEDFDPAKLTPRDLLDYKAFLLTVKGFKTATVNRRLSAVSRFLNVSIFARKCTAYVHPNCTTLNGSVMPTTPTLRWV